ncbi:DNA helicase [Tanacetum coccineum]
MSTLNRAMELYKDAGSGQHDKGKMIFTELEITNISELTAASYNNIIEAIVYRKWTSKNTSTRTATKFCCILIDKAGTLIQTNMSLRDAEYFDQLLKLQKAYRFSGLAVSPQTTGSIHSRPR